MIRQLDVPEAWQLVHQDWVLLDEGIEDVLHRGKTALTARNQEHEARCSSTALVSSWRS